MCGITGWIDQTLPDVSLLKKMTDALSHRGPNEAGYYTSSNVALGHRRLSVIDLIASHQPMKSACGRYVLVFNGEIYNFKALRQDLLNRGCQFKTMGDTEVLLQLLIHEKEAALNRLEGMFAFAFWDEHQQTLLVARDHTGIKPLHYFYDGKRLIFSSEIKSFFYHPEVSREIDLQALHLFLECQFIPAPSTIYKNIKKLPPAHYIKYTHGNLEIHRYWSINYRNKFDLEEAVLMDQLDHILQNSVKSMLVADVTCGSFLSGGVDSSLIAAIMQKQSDKKLPFFTIGFENNTSHSEHEYAKKVAHYIGAEHHCIMAQPYELLSCVSDMVETFDEPFGDQAALPTFFLSKFAAKKTTVVLSGEGADEIFAGYSNYQKRLHDEEIVKYLRKSGYFLSKIYPYLPSKLRAERLVKAASRSIDRRYLTVPKLFDSVLAKQHFSKDFLKFQIQHLEDLASLQYQDCNSRDYLDHMLHIDQNLWLPDDLLTKVDRATMAFSLEARVPYLDHNLIEFMARVPAHFKIQNHERKYLLKKVAERYLPKETVWRSKQGLVMPLHEWLHDDFKRLVKQTLSLDGLLKRNIFNKLFLHKLLAFDRGQQSTRLFSLMMLEMWFQRYEPDFKV